MRVKTSTVTNRGRAAVAGTFLQYGLPAALALVFVLLAGGLQRSFLNYGTELLILALIAMAWNLIGGFGGQFSLGHSVFVGIGGYTVAVLFDETGLPFPVVLLAAGVLSALAGVILGYPMLRLRGPYFAIGTLGIALAVTSWMLNWSFTKASQAYSLPARDMLRLPQQFQLAVVLAAAVLIIVTAIVKSPLGLRLVALRDDERGAASLGVRRVRTLLPVWAVSGFITGLTGALVAFQQGSLTPAFAFNPSWVLDAIVICVVGGSGTLYGPLVGAVLVFVLRQWTTDFSDWATLIEAVVVLLVVRLVPGGVWGVCESAVAAIRRRVRRGPPDRVASNPVEEEVMANV